MREAGVGGYEAATWYGLYAARGTPIGCLSLDAGGIR